MNAFTHSCDPSPDMEEVWKRSLIRVIDELTLPSRSVWMGQSRHAGQL